MITFVTAFLCGSTPKRSLEIYHAWFTRLAETGVPIVLFLDPKTGLSSFPSNVHVVPASLADTWVGHNVPTDVVLPSVRSVTDTREYMMIQNTKTEFVLRASHFNPWNTEWFAWIDFGIGHVFRDPDRTFERIRNMVPPVAPCIRTAGIWHHTPNSLFDGVCWRFAGGFFLVHNSRAEEFHNAVLTSIQTAPGFAWEVNIWAQLERDGMDLGWFQTDHNDSIIPTNEVLRPLDQTVPLTERF